MITNPNYPKIYNPIEHAAKSAIIHRIGPTPIDIVIGLVCLIIGLIFTFFGKRQARLCTSISNFLFFSITSYFFLNLTDLAKTNLSSVIIIAFFIGCLGAWMLDHSLKTGVCLIGLAAGADLAVVVISLVSNYSIMGFSICFGLILLILTYYVTDSMIVINTSFIGSQIFMHGISSLSLVHYFIDISFTSNYYVNSTKFWVMFAFSLFLAVSGLGFQFRKFGNYKYLPVEQDYGQFRYGGIIVTKLW